MKTLRAFELLKAGFFVGLITGVALGSVATWQTKTLIDTTSKLEIVQWALRH